MSKGAEIANKIRDGLPLTQEESDWLVRRIRHTEGIVSQMHLRGGDMLAMEECGDGVEDIVAVSLRR